MKVRGTRTGNASTRLQALKAARGWSVRKMAVAFGVDTSSAWRWLKGKQEPSGSVIALLERMEAETSHAGNEALTRLHIALLERMEADPNRAGNVERRNEGGDELSNTIARLQALKAARGWSLRHMGAAFGVDKATVCRWLNGAREPDGSVIAQLERIEADPSHAENVDPRTRLRKWADARGFGVAELATVFDVTPATVSRWLRGETDLKGPAWILLRVLDGEADTIVDGIKVGRTAESVPVSPVRVIARAVVGQTPYDLEERMIPTTVRLWVRKCDGDPVPEGAIDFGEVWCLDLDSLKISV